MKLFNTLALLAATALPAISFAENSTISSDWLAKERFMIRGRLINVEPDETSTTSLGGSVNADSTVVPELDITYFFNKNWAAELILATSKHDMSHESPTLDLGDVWILPPTLNTAIPFSAG
ncbi:MAG: hypothetical protein OXR68_04845 [Alphaproteobacteria bacterium]|nr:hypothetical protein [Alphaproteobacteria bacterium]MDD9919935.1 hypothetical protein [Alphaproteobacteria bacterium]